MEHLTKQQIVLVTLLVSFVTSISTGIVTVSLIDQNSGGVTQTINRVVERTIERVVPTTQSASSADASDRKDGSASDSPIVKVQDQIANAVDRSSQSLVQIKRLASVSAGEEEITGFGLIVSKDGVIVTDKSTISTIGEHVAILPDKQEVPIQVFQAQNDGDIAFLIARVPTEKKNSIIFKPVTFVNSNLKLGETVFAIGGTAGNFTLSQGFIQNAEVSEMIDTSIPSKKVTIGSPLVTVSGEFVGMKTSSFDDGDTASFYPLSLVKPAIPKEGTFK